MRDSFRKVNPMRVSIQNNDQAIAVVPHLLGFEPKESLVVVPVAGGRAPIARLDLPETAQEAREVIESVAETYGRDRLSGCRVLVVCFSDNPPATEGFSRELQAALEARQVGVVRRLAAGQDDWIDFTTHTRGARSLEERNVIDAAAVFAGRPVPYESRETLAAGFQGDTDLIAEALPASRAARDASTRGLERSYCRAVVEQFQCDHERLDLGDAARLLANLEVDPELFLKFASAIRTSNAAEWLPLWKDLTAHAPEEVRVEPACLAALSAWCSGDGASAWSALDRLPADMPPDHPIAPVARLLRESLRTAAHPTTWDTVCEQAVDSSANPKGLEVPAIGAEPTLVTGPTPDAPDIAI